MNILTVNLLYGSVVSANGSTPSFADRVTRLPAADVGSVETPVSLRCAVERAGMIDLGDKPMRAMAGSRVIWPVFRRKV
jgi:hypothetical protein